MTSEELEPIEYYIPMRHFADLPFGVGGTPADIPGSLYSLIFLPASPSATIHDTHAEAAPCVSAWDTHRLSDWFTSTETTSS